MCWARRSCPDPRRGGFSLAEVTVALVLLMLLVGIAGRVVRVKDQVVEGLEEDLEGSPVWYLVPDEDPMARVLGVPAALSTTPAHAGGSSGGGGAPPGGPGNGGGNGNAGGNGNGQGPGHNNGQGPGGNNGSGNGNGNGQPGTFLVGAENLIRDLGSMSASVRFVRVRQ